MWRRALRAFPQHGDMIMQVLDNNSNLNVVGCHSISHHFIGPSDNLVGEVNEGEDAGSKSDGCDGIHFGFIPFP